MDLKKLLKSALSPKQVEREFAFQVLQDSISTDYMKSVESIVCMFCNLNNDPFIRKAAGLFFKNNLLNDSKLEDTLVDKWINLDEIFRDKIKILILQTLGHEATGLNIAAQMIVAIVHAEYRQRHFENLVPFLAHNITKSNDVNVIVASLETINYFYQDVDHRTIFTVHQHLFKLIIDCMKSGKDVRVRLAATKAMLSAITFTDKNFQIESQRDVIMSQIFNVVASNNEELKTVGLDCYSEVISLYYDVTERYLTREFVLLTIDAMKSTNEFLVRRSVEFWCLLSHLEVKMMHKAEISRNSNCHIHFFCKKAAPLIIPVLFELLCIIISEDDDTWTSYDSAIICLEYLIQLCPNAMFDPTISLVVSNWSVSQAERRDATMIFLGLVINYCSASEIDIIIYHTHAIVFKLCADISPQVREGAFWALGSIYSRYHRFAQDVEKTKESLNLVLDAAMDVPKSAYNVLWALSRIIKASYNSLYEENHVRPSTFCMSNCYQNLFNLAYTTMNRHDVNKARLRVAANDTDGILVKNLELILREWGKLFIVPTRSLTPIQYAEFSEMQTIWCNVLIEYFGVLRPQELGGMYQTLMMTLISFYMITDDSLLKENLLSSLSNLILYAPEDVVIADLSHLMNALFEICQDPDAAVCEASLSVIKNVCWCVESNIALYCDQIIDIAKLSFDRPDFNIECNILASKLLNGLVCILGLGFKPYVAKTLKILNHILVCDILEVRLFKTIRTFVKTIQIDWMYL
ncbi:Importin subunit beta-1 [Thelohanellus kitauei]|uniref:Importin subunit beta-1 n=1 Tax=Thelohanellus kitauei TaxID=669202 RepID=A0A0C2JAP7_THEKT|nr:Importin subunit beta-1 [Thelohanellus kitauei]